MAELLMLKPYLDAPDFRVALREIAREFRASLGLPLDQDELGVICPDVEVAAAHLEETYGAGPFMLAEGPAFEFNDRGEKVLFRTRVGFGYYQGVLIELAEPGIGSDIFSTHLDPGGQISIQHLGYFARGKKHKLNGVNYAKALADKGYKKPTWTAAVFAGITGNVSLYDTYKAADNIAIEFLDFRLAGIPIEYPRGINEMIGRLQVKHGPRVVRVPGPSDEPIKLQWGFYATRVIPGKTPAEVWPWVSEPNKLAKWWEGTVTGPASPAVGVQWKVSVDMDGKDLNMIENLTMVDAPNQWQSSSDRNDLFSRSKTVLTVTSDPLGARVVWQVSFVPETTFHGLELADAGDAWMEESLDRLEELAGDGAITSNVIFRHFKAKNLGIIKIKGNLAAHLYDQLTEPVKPNRCALLAPKKCKRMGQSMIASTQNIVDKVVVEIRFSANGKLAERTSDWALYHSLANNRVDGSGTLFEDAVRLSGDAAKELRAFLGGQGSDDVVLDVVNLAKGSLRLRAL